MLDYCYYAHNKYWQSRYMSFFSPSSSFQLFSLPRLQLMCVCVCVPRKSLELINLKIISKREREENRTKKIILYTQHAMCVWCETFKVIMISIEKQQICLFRLVSSFLTVRNTRILLRRNDFIGLHLHIMQYMRSKERTHEPMIPVYFEGCFKIAWSVTAY